MLERLNVEYLKGIDMSQVKGMGDAALNRLKEIDMSQVKSMGESALKSALKSINRLSKKRLNVKGYSVNPLLVGGAVVLALGGYLLYKNRGGRRTAFAGNTAMEGQEYPVK